MGIQHNILAATYPLLRWKNVFFRKIINGSQKRLRVLLYHDVAPADEARFAAQLRWLQRRWNFVSPEMFVAMVDGHEPVKHDSLLLTFDDGFASNRKVAESILRPMGIRAVFFIVSDFVAIISDEDSKRFVVANIHPGLSRSLVPDYCCNMTWADLDFLLGAGHVIGAHTRTHQRLSLVPGNQLVSEIVDSADFLSRSLGIKIDHFAYTFGDLSSFSAEALAVARSRFAYIYTGIRGDNANDGNAWAIRRDSMCPSNSNSLLGAFLEGGADSYYSQDLAQYEAWGRI